MEVDDLVAVVISSGENLPESPPKSPVVFIEPTFVKDGKQLTEFLKLHAPHATTMLYVGMMLDGCFGWRPLSKSLQSIPRVASRIIVFCRVPTGDALWDDQAIALALLEDYKDTLVLSRSRYTNPRRQEGTPLPLSNGSLDMDIGQYFKLMGRDETYRVLLHGGLRLFKNFVTKSGSPSAFSRQPAFFSMVSFPGAGKSTFGLDFSSFLVEMWKQMPQQVQERILKFYLQDAEREQYLQMIEQFHTYNLCCYHSLEVTPTGRWLSQENGLCAPEILALRCLHAAVCQPSAGDYSSFLSGLQAKRHGLCSHIRLKHVIGLIRSSLGIEPRKRLLVCWFIDEANAAVGSFPQDLGEGEDKPTWLQAVLSEYVENLQSLHKEGSATFPILTIGTTRFSAGNLKFTKTGKAKAILVPLRPLKFKEMEGVVLGLMNRLALTLQQQPAIEHNVPRWLQLILRFCGGIPRVLALAIQSLSDENLSRSPESLLTSLRRKRTYSQVIVFLNRFLGCLSQTDYFLGYLKDFNKVAVLLRAMAVSVLGYVVTRQSKVIEDSIPIFRDSWGDLEAEGLVALKLHDATYRLKAEENVELRELVTAVDPGNAEVQVLFCPLLLFHLNERYLALPDDRTWLFSVPQVHCQWWKRIEGAHIGVLMLRLELLRLSFRRDTFIIRDLFPSHVNVPDFLARLCFYMPPENHAVTDVSNQLRSRDMFLLHAQKNSESYAFLGPSNYGPDSWFCATEITKRRKVFFLLQSRSTLSDNSYVSCAKILESFSHDCQKWFCVPKLSSTQLTSREDILSSNYEEVSEMSTTRRYDLRPHHHKASFDLGVEDIGSEIEEMEMEAQMEDLIEEYIYIYCTDEKVSSKTHHQLQDLALCGDPWAEKIILWYSQKDSLSADPLALLSLLRYMNES